MKGVTVEGADAGKCLAPDFYSACASGALRASGLPLTSTILCTIDNDAKFDFVFEALTAWLFSK